MVEYLNQLGPRLLNLSSEIQGALLGLDTSLPLASICTVNWQENMPEEITLPSSVQRSEALVSTLANKAKATNFDFKKLKAVVIGLGPGSFTGLRVGLATVKGICVGAGIPLFGVSSLGVLAATYGPGVVAVVLDARLGTYFSAIYNVNQSGEVTVILPDGVRTPDEVVQQLRQHKPICVVGDMAPQVCEKYHPEQIKIIEQPTPRIALGFLQVEQRILRGASENISQLVPKYMRRSQAERQLGS